MNEQNPNWLFPKEYGDFSEVTIEMRDAGVFIEGDAELWTHMTRWGVEYEIDCSHCGKISDAHYMIEDSYIDGMLDISWRYKCNVCSKKFSVTSGTWLANHKLPMEYWWRTAYLLGDFNMEVNSCWLSRDLKITQKTTHLILIIIAKALGEKRSSPLKTSKDTLSIMEALLTIRKLRT